MPKGKGKGKGKGKREEIIDEYDINTINDDDTEELEVLENEDKDNIEDEDEDENLKNDLDNDIDDLEEIDEPVDDIVDDCIVDEGISEEYSDVISTKDDEGDFSQQDTFGTKKMSPDAQYQRTTQSILNQIRKAHKIKSRKTLDNVLKNEPYIY